MSRVSSKPREGIASRNFIPRMDTAFSMAAMTAMFRRAFDVGIMRLRVIASTVKVNTATRSGAWPAPPVVVNCIPPNRSEPAFIEYSQIVLRLKQPDMNACSSLVRLTRGMNKRWGFILVSVLVAAGVAFAIWGGSGPPEPVYEGRKLTSWLERHVPNTSANPPYNSPGWHKAEEALRRMGTNAIPTLLRMI